MTKINIENFQSIKKIDFEINGFTVIIGKNNIGKSAIIRAIDAALNNQTGKHFIRKGQKKTRVVIDYKDTKFEWEKSINTASYKIEGYKEPFTKLKGAVPKPITDAGFQKMQIGDQKISPLIAPQFDPLFLINKPGAVVTEVLANLYQIDTLSIADDLCQKVIKSNKSLLKTRESDLKELQVDLERYKNFEEIKKTVKLLAKKEKEGNDLREEIILIKSYEEKIKILMGSLIRLRVVRDIKIPNKSNCKKVFSELPWIQATDNKYRASIALIKELKDISKIKIPKITKCERTFSELPWIQLADDRYQTSYALIEKLKNLPEIEFPEESECGKILKEVEWLQKNSSKYNESTLLLKRLKNISKIKVPEIKKVEILFKEALQFQSWSETIKKITENIKQQKITLKTLDIDEINKFSKKVASVLDDYIRIQLTEQKFLSIIKILKSLRDELKNIDSENKRVIKEMGQFKTCPLCERPLCQNS